MKKDIYLIKKAQIIYKVKNLLDINNKEDIDKIIKELEVF